MSKGKFLLPSLIDLVTLMRNIFLMTMLFLVTVAFTLRLRSTAFRVMQSLAKQLNSPTTGRSYDQDMPRGLITSVTCSFLKAFIPRLK